jgi:hypothetical protein
MEYLWLPCFFTETWWTPKCSGNLLAMSWSKHSCSAALQSIFQIPLFFFLLCIFIYFLLLLYQGNVLTLTKVLTICLSWIHTLHCSPLSLYPTIPGTVSILYNDLFSISTTKMLSPQIITLKGKQRIICKSCILGKGRYLTGGDRQKTKHA